MEPSGILKLKCNSAKLSRDSCVLGKMDPYVAFSIDKLTKQTRVHLNGGVDPVWEEKEKLEFTLPEGPIE